MIDPVFNKIFGGSPGVYNIDQSLLTHLLTYELLILSPSGIAEIENSLLQQ